MHAMSSPFPPTDRLEANTGRILRSNLLVLYNSRSTTQWLLPHLDSTPPPLPPSSFTHALPVSIQQEVPTNQTAHSPSLAHGTTVEQLIVPSHIHRHVLVGYIYAFASKYAEAVAVRGIRPQSRPHRLAARFAFDLVRRDFIVVQVPSHAQHKLGVMSFCDLDDVFVRKAFFSIPPVLDDIPPTTYLDARVSVSERSDAHRLRQSSQRPTSPMLRDLCSRQCHSNSAIDNTWHSDSIFDVVKELSDDIAAASQHANDDLIHHLLTQVSLLANQTGRPIDYFDLEHGENNTASSMNRLENVINGTFIALHYLENCHGSEKTPQLSKNLGREYTVIGSVDRMIVEVERMSSNVHYSDSFSARIDQVLNINVRKRIAAWRCEQRRRLQKHADNNELQSLKRSQPALETRLHTLRVENEHLKQLAEQTGEQCNYGFSIHFDDP